MGHARFSASGSPWAAAALAASGAAGGLGAAIGCQDVTVQLLVPTTSASVAAPPSCAPPAAPACVAQLGEECRDEKQCCSGACLVAEDEKKRCVRAAACASYCETCEDAGDCCSGSCQDDGTGRLVCWSRACLAQGEICRSDAQCCVEAGPVRCVEDPAGLKTKRCRLDSSGPPCVGDGVPCSENTECCGGYCIGEPEPVCTAACVADGELCAAATDCCSPGATCEGADADLVCTAPPVP
ncbi:MAG: hypothetical protein JW751_02015 [Polyangiaceae bacterium]|nr:hypothetical protein [Polyangiaceae bacterium]